VGACYETFFICIPEMADVMLAKPRAAAVIALENFMMLMFRGVITFWNERSGGWWRFC
jgi:hypothetical protein